MLVIDLEHYNPHYSLEIIFAVHTTWIDLFKQVHTR